jgi:hypothetical protein
LSSAVKRRRVGVATTSGSGETIAAGLGETVPWEDSSMGIAVVRRAPSSPRMAYFLSAFMRGVHSPPATLIEERHSVPLILAQREGRDERDLRETRDSGLVWLVQ